MYEYALHQQLNERLHQKKLKLNGGDNLFYTRFLANISAIHALYETVYGQHAFSQRYFGGLIDTIIRAYTDRSEDLRQLDETKQKKGAWFCSNELCGMSLYVDRFAGDLKGLEKKLPYLRELGVNFLHLMPLFKSPEGESDGGYAVADFRKVDERFGTLKDLKNLRKKLHENRFSLMLDIVLNHTSHQHEWAQKAKAGNERFQNFFYTYPDRSVPDAFEKAMPEIFPEAAPGSFTWNDEMQRWVMTVFHHYQWDLNYANPEVFTAMLDTVFFYANLGVDILRIDAPAFIWKEAGTTCQNLPGAHTLLRLFKQCVQVAAPGMALLGEAIVAPAEIMAYFGEGQYRGRECDVAYNATQMALGWDALATGDTRIMLAAQHLLRQKPRGTTWITYTRCHDDIGLGYDDYIIAAAGYQPYAHRQYLMEYYTGTNGSPSSGALFSVNVKTGDARISGTLASLCGLENALVRRNDAAIALSIQKILLLQAHAIFLGGIPVLFYGDELGYINDYSFLNEPGKSYDNRWMHRPVIDWAKAALRNKEGTVEQLIFSGTKRLLALRKSLPAIADRSNIVWLSPHNAQVAGYIRKWKEQTICCLFNFGGNEALLTWYAFREKGIAEGSIVKDHWSGEDFTVGADTEHFVLPPYHFAVLEVLE